MAIKQPGEIVAGICLQASRLLVIFLLFHCIAGCSPKLRPGNMAGPTTVTMKVDSTINGIRRRALVHLPHSFDYRRRWPLVIVLHGAFSTAEQMEQVTGFSTLADRQGFVVLYPEGMGLFGFLQHWNAGHCCGKAAEDGLDDVAFIDECIFRLAEYIPIDLKRIYITGFSNGAMLAHKYAAERSGRVAAVAALGGAIGGRPSSEVPFWRPPPPDQPVAALLVHGTNDESVPVEGGRSLRKKGDREYLPFRDGIRFWLQANSCSEQHRVEKAADGQIETTTYTDCRNGSEVRVCLIHGWGHRWPGRYFTREDESLNGFDIGEEIWRFFSRFSSSL